MNFARYGYQCSKAEITGIMEVTGVFNGMWISLHNATRQVGLTFIISVLVISFGAMATASYHE